MPANRKPKLPPHFVAHWPLPPAATLGSSVRAKGILQEIRARMPSWPQRRALTLEGATLVLGLPEDAEAEFCSVSALVETALVGIETLPVLPREIEDILAIKTGERHRWLKDGRLPSAGTRTVKLRGRARAITFHVFDPVLIEQFLDDDRIATWREDDAITAAENRRKAAWNRKLKRAEATSKTPRDKTATDLAGWEAFEREGLLR
jgi:hypothetical protein